MVDTSSEDLIFLLDTSASMFRNDGMDDNCITRSLQVIEKIIDKKIKIDPKDRYAIVLFGQKVQTIPDMVYTREEIMTFIEEYASFEHSTALGDALSQTVQLILKQMRFIGQKLFRLLILSDGSNQVSRINPINIAKIAMQLGIVIDVIRFGAGTIPGNLLKKLADITHGEHIYISDPNELDAVITKLSKKKEKKHSTVFDKKDDSEDSVIQDMLGEIADIPLKLEQMTEEQKNQALYNLEPGKKLTCTICYSDRCMVDKTGFFGCGRFCPNCLTPFHLHCAIQWSESQNNKKSGTKSSIKQFRCPHCFYLLKIPISDVEHSGNDKLSEENRILRKVDLKSHDINGQICNSEDCGIILKTENDQTVYQCSSCNSYFHLDCAKTAWQKEKKCPYCQKYVSIEQ